MMPGMSKQFIRVPRWCSLILSRADNEQVPDTAERGPSAVSGLHYVLGLRGRLEGYTLDGPSPPFESRTI
ncbi:hypothetical protein FHX16_004705 [Rhizobium sp. BK661]|nr:hypothetical protein [Rhizobium sp. BK661]